jgi:hypothetical protein
MSALDNEYVPAGIEERYQYVGLQAVMSADRTVLPVMNVA